MKFTKLSTFVAFVLSLLFGSNALAQAPAAARTDTSSLLYEVTGKGLAKPSYVFGTMHAACETDVVPLETIGKYLNQTDQLVMELDLDDPAELGSMASSVMIPAGKTLKDYLTPEEFAKVDAMVMSLMGVSAEAVKSIKPIMLSVVLLTSQKAIGCAPPVTYDLSLAKLAAAAKKPVIGLETAAEQVALIDSKPVAKQAKELYEMSRDTAKSLKDMKDLIEAYRSRSSDRLFELSVVQSKSDREFFKRLLDDRNIAWIPKLESSMKSKSTFVAVGAAHLGGKDGVLALLRSKGYTVTPIKL
ncbi:MAG TPA: TraB/GumN family protein [Pyrinomonadaceae bacterium]|nr:TraB/GumN family protein [Pyrinomonadaceae bacterium]